MHDDIKRCKQWLLIYITYYELIPFSSQSTHSHNVGLTVTANRTEAMRTNKQLSTKWYEQRTALYLTFCTHDKLGIRNSITYHVVYEREALE